jgi:hypothetical protein
MWNAGQVSTTKLQLTVMIVLLNAVMNTLHVFKLTNTTPTCHVLIADLALDANNVVVTEDNAQHINVYSFALNPEEHQPSGTCNFSRIDNATLVLNNPRCADGVLKVFAVNYNVLRIMSGMGGLAYSN